MLMPSEGQCYCGKIRYLCSSPPTSFQHCHCSQCQGLHGASFVTWVGFRTKDCRIEDPENILKIFHTEKAERAFCGHCGTHFCFRYTQPDTTLDQQHFTYFAATTLTQIPIKLSDEINPERYGNRQHIFEENQPYWSRDFVHTPKHQKP